MRDKTGAADGENMKQSTRRRMVVVCAALAVLFVACATAAPKVRPSDRSRATDTTIREHREATLLVPVEQPLGATVPGTEEWYQAPAPEGHSVTLGVYRPVSSLRVEHAVTLLILPGGDGLRRLYEELAQRFTAAGFIAVVGSWYEHEESTCPVDAIHCPNGPIWKGMNAAAVADVDALVVAVKQVEGVDPGRVVLLGQSYGGGVALLRAAEGHPEPVVSASGLVSRAGFVGTPLATDEFPSDVAGSIRAPVLVVDGRSDPITPIVMAEALVAAMPVDNPATVIYYPEPANHAFPWQSEAFPDRPDVPMSTRFVEDVGAWIRGQLP